MIPHTLEEFAQELRRKGNSRETDFADMILQLLDLETDIAEPFDRMCDDIAFVAPEGLKDKPEKQLEWVIDRSNLLKDIEDVLDEQGRTGDTDDQVKALVETVENIRLSLGLPDTATDEQIETAVQALVDSAPAPMEYDL